MQFLLFLVYTRLQHVCRSTDQLQISSADEQQTFCRYFADILQTFCRSSVDHLQICNRCTSRSVADYKQICSFRTGNKKEFMVTVDYFSNFWEVDCLTSTTSAAIILKLKNHFAQYGCPDHLISDNGPQFASSEFTKFAKEWDFEHRTNSPGNSKANGKVESAVKTAKNLIRKAVNSRADPYIAILDYRNTPTQGMESSPVRCLMNRRIRTLLPTTKALLQPRTPQTDREIKDLTKRQAQQSKYYNQQTRDLPTLTEAMSCE